MRVVVLSCKKYSDAWTPFFRLFQQFWPNCPYPVWLVTDSIEGADPANLPDRVHVYDHPSWNRILSDFCREYDDEPIMLFLEDYFLTSTPNQRLIDHALLEYMFHKAACVRLYPCPGGDEEYGDPYFARVPDHAPYRISTQVGIWYPGALRVIADNTDSPQAFELDGSRHYKGGPIFAFKRDVQPWPLEYICTAIVRGVWQRGAIEHCERHQIPIDTSKRQVQS